MSFAAVNALTTFHGFSSTEQTLICTAMQTAYDNSATARSMFDSFIGVSGNNISITKMSGVFQAYAGTGDLELDLSWLTDNNYLSTTGEAVEDTLLSGLIHELGHALAGYLDMHNGTDPLPHFPSNDFMGDNVRFVNSIFAELGIAEQASYIGYDAAGSLLVRGYQYTNGHAVTGVIVGDGNFGTGATDDLLIGGTGSNALSGVGGDDYLYGAGGQDVLKPGSGNDFVNGAGPNVTSDQTDTVDYSTGDQGQPIPGGIEVTFDFATSNQVGGRQVFVVNDDGYGDSDQIVSIEQVIATSHTDTFHFLGTAANNLKLTIQGGGGTDVLDFTAVASAYAFQIDASGAGGAKVRADNGKIGFSQVTPELKGSAHDDVFNIARANAKVDAGDGDDLIVSTNGSIEVLGGAGKDRISVAAGQTVDGGTGNDIFDLRAGGGATIKVGANAGHDTVLNWGTLTLDFGTLSASSIAFGWDPVESLSEPLITYDGLWRLMTYEGAADIRTPDGGIVSLEGLTFSGFRIAKGFDNAQDLTGDPYGPLAGVTPDWTLTAGLTFQFSDGTYTFTDLLIASGALTTDTGGIYGYPDPTSPPPEPIDYPSAPIELEGFASGVSSTAGANVAWATDFFGQTPITSSGGAPMVSTSGNDVFVGDSASYALADARVSIDLGLGGEQETEGSGVDAFIGTWKLIGSQYGDDLTASSSGSDLSGEDGDDVLTGLSGYDVLNGGNGADTLSGGGGGDTINAGDGADEIVASSDGGEIDGGLGDDTVTLDGARSDFRFGRTAEGAINFVAANGSPWAGATLVTNVETVQFLADSSQWDMDALAGGYGTAGNDTVLGTSEDNHLYGLDGDDILFGGAGNDIYFGGEGFDQANLAGALPDYAFSRSESGAVNATHLVSGPSLLLVDVEAVYFEGSTAWMTVEDLVGDYGTEGNDPWISGTVRDDSLFGLEGDDTLKGDDGDDRLVGGSGADQAHYEGAFADFDISRQADGSVVVSDLTGPEGTDTLNGIEALYFEAGDTWQSVQALLGDYGTENSDAWLQGTSRADRLFGLTGDDTLVGFEEDDTVDGGDGYDQANYEGSFPDFTIARQADGSVLITDTVGNEGADLLIGIEAVYFNASQTWLDLSPYAYDRHGTSGDDDIAGNGYRDNLYGLDGNDTLTGNGGLDRLFGGLGADLARFNGSYADYAFSQNADGTTSVTDLAGGDGTSILEDVEDLEFLADQTAIGLAAALATGGAHQDIDGTVDGDYLEGTSRNDHIYGLEGDDILVGYSGTNWLFGGDGIDTVQLDGRFEDYVFTQNIDGSVTVSDVARQNGDDVLHDVENVLFLYNYAQLGIADAILLSNGGRLQVTGTSAADTLYGSAYADEVQAGAGHDVIRGSQGDDHIYGGDGSDTARYSGKLDDFSVVQNVDGSYTVTDNETVTDDDGVDTLFDVEYLDFFDDGQLITIANAAAVSSGAGIDFVGTEFGDTLNGTPWHDNFYGYDWADLISPRGGNDSVYGGDGIDTVSYYGAREDFVVSYDGVNFFITDLIADRNGTDLLDNIELVHFSIGDDTVQLMDLYDGFF